MKLIGVSHNKKLLMFQNDIKCFRQLWVKESFCIDDPGRKQDSPKTLICGFFPIPRTNGVCKYQLIEKIISGLFKMHLGGPKS